MQLRLITNMALLNSQHIVYMLVVQHLTLPTSQQLRRLEHILNLPPIHLMTRQHIEFFVTEAMVLPLGRSVEEIDPDVAARGFAELAVPHADVYAGLEGGVDVVDPVGGEEEDAFIVLEDAEEDGDEFVAFQVVRAALFEEDVGFVEEEDSVPFACHFEDVGQRGFHLVRVETEITGAHHVERSPHSLGDLELSAVADQNR